MNLVTRYITKQSGKLLRSIMGEERLKLFFEGAEVSLSTDSLTFGDIEEDNRETISVTYDADEMDKHPSSQDVVRVGLHAGNALTFKVLDRDMSIGVQLGEQDGSVMTLRLQRIKAR